ncbi:unnamed protein product [Soboliphyme baturini]|uniref:DUF4760 domain-containing protein n=1 Tax=Soboliphyme baturini TaxID=241478 RepID=A0A183J4J6_9BILA|nr:unnamed protein product [Soboliphyme baturini]
MDIAQEVASGDAAFDFTRFFDKRSDLFATMSFSDIQWFYVRSKNLKTVLHQSFIEQRRPKHGVTKEVSLTPVTSPRQHVIKIVYGRAVSNDEYTLYRLMGVVAVQALQLSGNKMKKISNPLALKAGLTYATVGSSYLVYTMALEFLFAKMPVSVMALCIYRARKLSYSQIDAAVDDINEGVTKALLKQKTKDGVSVKDWLADEANVKAVVERYEIMIQRIRNSHNSDELRKISTLKSFCRLIDDTTLFHLDYIRTHRLVFQSPVLRESIQKNDLILYDELCHYFR